MKVTACIGRSVSCGTPVAARSRPAATRGGAGLSSPPILSTAGAYATVAGTGGERAGRGDLQSLRLPAEETPLGSSDATKKGFSDPFCERLEAPGTRAAVFLLRRAKRRDRPTPLAAGQDPRLPLRLTPKFTDVHRPPPHLPRRCRAGGAPRT